MATYTVYMAEFRSLPTFHRAIYIEAEVGKGWTYQVVGGHGPGWEYETKESNNIENSRQFYKKYAKGTVAEADLNKVDPICRAIAMPRIEYRGGIRIDSDCRNWVESALGELEKRDVFKPEK